MEKKENMEWTTVPVLSSLEEKKKKEQKQIPDLEEGVAEIKKKHNIVASKLKEY